mgnify:CR=1 FL=1
MEATATISNGRVTQIQITNPGSGYTFGTVELVGGFAFNDQFFIADANDQDGVVEKVTFFENGIPLSSDQFYPYEFTWSPGQPGFYDLYFEATDDRGNKSTSEIMRREVFYDTPPKIEFEPVIQANLRTTDLVEKTLAPILYIDRIRLLLVLFANLLFEDILHLYWLFFSHIPFILNVVFAPHLNFTCFACSLNTEEEEKRVSDFLDTLFGTEAAGASRSVASAGLSPSSCRVMTLAAASSVPSPCSSRRPHTRTLSPRKSRRSRTPRC